MTPDKIHPIHIQETYPTEGLGKEIFALRYDLLLEVIRGMKKEAHRQAEGDRQRGRRKLAKELEKSILLLEGLEANAEALVAICAPYIEAEKKKSL